MKKVLKFSVVVAAALSVMLSSCSDANDSDAMLLVPALTQKKASNDVQSEDESRGLQSWSLWDAMDWFDQSKFNKANWSNGGMFNCGFVPENVNFKDGKMTITLNNKWSHGKPYSSGEYRTNNTFSYGTFETNMIAAKGDGLVTSFFLYTGNPWDEIDVEILGKDTTKVQFNYYVDGVANNEKIIDLGFDAAYGYHKYAIEYGSGYINWYVDGKWRYGVNNTGFNAPYGKKMPSHPMQIMVNLWPGTGVDSWLNHFWWSGNKYASYDYIKYTPK